METDQPCLKTEDDNIPQTEIRWTPAEANLDDTNNCPDEDCAFQMTYMLTIDITDINNVCIITLLKFKQP